MRKSSRLFMWVICMGFTTPALASHGHASPGEAWPPVRLQWALSLTARDYERVTGKTLNPLQRIAFPLLKSKMKKALSKNPDMTIQEFLSARKKMATWLKILLIVLGALLLAFIIFALAYGGVI